MINLVEDVPVLVHNFVIARGNEANVREMARQCSLSNDAWVILGAVMRLTLLQHILTDNYMSVRGIICMYVCLMSPRCIFENHLVVPSLY